MNLQKILFQLNTNWKQVLLQKIDLISQINITDEFYPDIEQIFLCFNYFEFENTKVVKIGRAHV